MAYRDSTTATASTTTPSVAVPAGVAINDIVILVCTADGASPVFDPADYPTGFTELFETSLSLDTQVVSVSWKRLSAADSGTYTFGSIVGVATPCVTQAFAFSGRSTTSDPTGTVATNNAVNPSPSVTVTASTVTALDGDDLLWISAPDCTATGAGNGHDAPAGYVEREDDELTFSNLSGATKDNASAGATGSVSGTFNFTSGNSGYAAYLIRIPSGAVAGTSYVVRHPIY